MWEWFINLTADGLMLLTMAAAFASIGLLWLAIGMKGQQVLTEYKETFTQTAGTNMADMFLFVDPSRLFVYYVGLMIVLPGAILLLTGGDIPSALAAFGLVLIFPPIFYKRMHAKRLQRFEQQLPDALTMVSGSMRAGASLSVALESLVDEQPPPVSQEFELFLREQRLGADFDDSLTHMEERMPLPDFRMLITALRINREVGGNLAETLETLADTLRKKAMMEGKIKGLTAQGKLQGIVMTGLPVILTLLLNFIEHDAISKLWTTPIGWMVLGAAIFWEIIGYIMISKVTNIDV